MPARTADKEVVACPALPATKLALTCVGDDVLACVPLGAANASMVIAPKAVILPLIVLPWCFILA
ncbi:MAG TPA: hypothetical protein VEV61_08765 [Streptosporangiaceae bacterium]|nr:hypothetical protein [Streptosporangiaceae bacterium]